MAELIKNPPLNSTLINHPLLQCKYCGEWGQWGQNVCYGCPVFRDMFGAAVNKVMVEQKLLDSKLMPPVIVKQCATTGQVIYIHLKH